MEVADGDSFGASPLSGAPRLHYQVDAADCFTEGQILIHGADMGERQYDQDEVAAIFKRAASQEHAGLPAPGEGQGLPLAALQEIGREVGFSPDAIASAALSLDQGPRAKPATLLGFRVGALDEAGFDRPISAVDWERLVADARSTFNAAGVVRFDGPSRQWSNGNLTILAEPTPTGHRLRLQTINGAAQRAVAAGLGAFLAAAGAMLVAPNAPSAGVGFLALGGVAALGIGGWRLRGWADLRQAQFAALIARHRSTGMLPPAAE